MLYQYPLLRKCTISLNSQSYLQVLLNLALTLYFLQSLLVKYIAIRNQYNILANQMQAETDRAQLNILILTELKKSESIELTRKAVEYLKQANIFNIYTESTSLFPGTTLFVGVQTQINYVISIGQNSTMMKALRVLDRKNLSASTIPIISISDGEQPIMSSYSDCEMEHVLKNFIQGLKNNNLRIMNTLQFQFFQREEKVRRNFSCQFEVHKDMMLQSVLKLKIYAKMEGKNFLHLTNIWSDGILISTPLGSLGRNINLSGPIVYKSLDSITIVPISPLSLNFRPIILPSTAELLIEVDEESRSPAQVYADGELIFSGLKGGKKLQLKCSDLTSKLVKGLSQKSTEQQWMSCLKEVLSWGETFGQQKNKNAKEISKF